MSEPRPAGARTAARQKRADGPAARKPAASGTRKPAGAPPGGSAGKPAGKPTRGAARRPAAAPRVKILRPTPPGAGRTLAGVALIPVSLLAAWSVGRAATLVLPCGDVTPYLSGAAIYALLHLLFLRPLFLHTVEHEFTHALFAKLSFGSVYAMHIASDDEGSVTMSKQNALISLAPYFFPLFATMALGVYLLAGDPFRPTVAYAAGMLHACHLLMTLRDLRVRQPDLEVAGGRLFCLPLLLLGQSLMLALFLVPLSNGELALADLADGVARLFGR